MDTVIEAPMADTRPPTETARVSVDLMDMARIVCAHTKDARGRPLKLTDFLDGLLRGPIVRKHTEVMRRIKDQD